MREKVLYHELGHALSDKIGEGGNEHSDFWKGAKKVADVSDKPGFTQSGKWEVRGTYDNPNEYIAELYATLMKEPGPLKKYFPDEYAWIVDKAKRVGFPVRVPK